MSQIFWLIFNAFFAGRVFNILMSGVDPDLDVFYIFCLLIHILGCWICAVSLWVDLRKGQS